MVFAAELLVPHAVVPGVTIGSFGNVDLSPVARTARYQPGWFTVS
jgi:hypothetical protein